MYQEISSGSGEHHLTGHKGSAQEKLWEICETLVQKEDQPTMRKFFDLNTVASRRQNTYTIETEYCGMDGKWWGSNPVIKAQDDVDLLAIDRSGRKAIFVECKFTSHPMPYDEYEDLLTATKVFPNMEESIYGFLVNQGIQNPLLKKLEKIMQRY